MENLPLYVYLLFGLTVLFSIFMFYKATHYSKSFLVMILLWCSFQIVMGASGFYQNYSTIPPRFALLLLPPIVYLIVKFNTVKGKAFIDSLDIKALTLFSVIRIPVEAVLFWLFTHNAVPELMTFEGRNFDILSGISAPVIYYFVFVNKKLSKNALLIWNFACLGLLLNIVINALLSMPTVLQQFAFNQPNIALGYVPFVLLPCCLVPLVLFSHLASIRHLLNKEQKVIGLRQR